MKIFVVTGWWLDELWYNKVVLGVKMVLGVYRSKKQARKAIRKYVALFPDKYDIILKQKFKLNGKIK